MIGQKNLLDTFKRQIEEGTFPRFSILCGVKGSGKKLAVIELGQYLTEGNIVFVEPKVDNIREMISTAYKVTMPTLYVLADADNMSPASKNAILKITEEPPNDAYFIMTLQAITNTIPTIRSRATVYHIDPYSLGELSQYFYEQYEGIPRYNDYRELVLNICETPGEIDNLMKTDVFAFYEFVEKVVDNIDSVSIANAFKIDSNISFKENIEEKYDLVLFYKIFLTICLERMKNVDLKNTDIFKYARGVEITAKALQSLRNISLNNQYVFDIWILDIREDWIYGTIDT